MSHNEGTMRPLLLVALLGVAAAACGPTPTAEDNPKTLWLSFSQREIDLVLVDQSPPPF